MPCERNPLFKVINAMGYNNLPTLAEMTALGFIEMHVMGVGQFQGKLVENPERLPNRRNSKYVLCEAGRYQDRVKFINIDIEHWVPRQEGSEDKLLEVIKMMKTLCIERGQLDKKLGFFASCPDPIRWRDLMNSQGVAGTVEMDEYYEINLRRQKVADEVDYIAPELYMYTSSLEEWKLYAKVSLDLAISMAKGKPIYPFIMPQYIPVINPEIGNGFVSGEIWKAQLDYLFHLCDGVIVWGYWNRDMSVEDEWWKEMIKFPASVGGGV